MTDRPPETTTRTVAELLDAIEDGRVSLADFQRDFDWSTSAIRSLLATLLMGWPAGALLMLDGARKNLATRKFEGGPEPKRGPRDLIVLDGQQRLTSMLHALTDRGDMYYSIPLSALRSGSVDDIEEGLKATADSPERVPASTTDPIIPLEAVRNQKAFFAWRDTLDVDEDARYALAQAYRDHLHWLHDHEFPIVKLDRAIEDSAVARIFERVNRTGLRLGSFDLVVARSFTDEWNLRNQWAEARLEYPLLDHFFEDDGLPVLQAIALTTAEDVRQAAVLELDGDVVSARWDDGVAAVNSALELLAQTCGVVRAEWLPYRAFVLVLSGLSLDTALPDQPEAIRKYVISRSFALRFDVAANTRIVEDYRMLRKALAASKIPTLKRAEDRQLLEATRQKRGALWRAFMCSIALNGAQDPLGNPMRSATLPLSSNGDMQKPEARPVPLVERDKSGAHLLALALVLASPDSAKAIRKLPQDATAANLDGLSESALTSQLLPDPETVLALRGSPADLTRARLNLLDEWLAENDFVD